MSGLALVLVLTSAFLHAGWNLLAKRAGNARSAGLIWLFSVCSAVIYAPIALISIVTQQTEIGLALLFAAGFSAVLHIGYFVLLQRGYRVGDMSVVYPLARGTGPMLSTVAAVLLFGERPTPIALIGTGMIGISVVWIASSGVKSQTGAGNLREAVFFALLTGAFIAAYTLWDKRSVSVLLIPPLAYDWMSNVFRTLLLSPLVVNHLPEVRATWQKHRLEVLGIATLSPLAYILVLFAMTFSPVSYIAPARELSILIGAVIGSRFLNEGHTTSRIGAAVLMTSGVILLAVG
jgi:drug/metabolite transporter (DMT)-like permease